MKTKDERPYVGFYQKHKISPVSQDISDANKHFKRRELLYRRLGVVPSFVEGKSVIEFGPGSGHNALYTHSLHPSKYVLVDANPTGLKECGELFLKYGLDEKSFIFVESLIEEYESRELYDVVLCEGVIPGQKNPKEFLSSVAKFTKPGGVCIITTQDYIGYFADLLRCLIGEIIVGEGASFEKEIEILIAAFSKHLKHLEGMNRPYKDWVLDNIMHRTFWKNQGSELLSMGDAIGELGSLFDVYGSSPHIFVDWRWYKDVYDNDNKFNQIGIDGYRKNLHNLLDCRYAHEVRPIEENVEISRLCLEIWRLIASFGNEKRKVYIEEICGKSQELEVMIRKFSFVTADALYDFHQTLKMYPAITPETDWGSFAAWWGRGTQYLSFIRNENEETM